MSFKGILGHEAVVSFLIQAIKNDKVAHAYIFKGPSGIGKASIAVN
ncbi:MAG TPA: DNA polymerase III subunit delta, partial [Candidatus Omnitrophota bacterium]|nr:DNA polymerase III subunit delta [Candidatus Omnitrophota bacterium]